MSSKWWDESWNPITGCTPTSPGCDNCYAKSMATRFAGTADLKRLVYNSEVIVDALNGRHGCVYPMAGENNSLDWVICGGETGPKARPVHPDWVKDIRNQCRASSVPFFFKGWGRRSQFVMVPGRILDGRTWDEVPE